MLGDELLFANLEYWNQVFFLSLATVSVCLSVVEERAYMCFLKVVFAQSQDRTDAFIMCHHGSMVMCCTLRQLFTLLCSVLRLFPPSI